MFSLVLLCMSLPVLSQAQKAGSITSGDLKEIQKSVTDNPATRARIDAITNNKIQELALNRANVGKVDKYISNRVETKGITDQKSSGRCWLYTGLNVIRPQVRTSHDMESFELSQTYPFFWDQFEKANLFLEGIIQSADKPLDDKMVEWLLKNPIGDGGQWTGVVDIIEKYGLVPAEIMPDTKNSESTGWMSRMLGRKLRQQAMVLRQMKTDGKADNQLRDTKVTMLGDIYRILVLCLGEPPTEFQWRYKKTNGELTEMKTYTPMSFYKDFVQVNLDDYVMFMNDPSREYHKLYEIEYDRHIYEGGNWKYINLPANEIKQIAKESILNNEAMYFSCDVGKQLNRDEGTLDVNNYNYNALFGVNFDMDKAERIQTYASGSTHGMGLVGVDLDENGNIRKWLLENSWGPSSGFNGFLIMTDQWFSEYMFRLVVRKEYIPEQVLKILDTEPTMLPPWDPMFAPEQ